VLGRKFGTYVLLRNGISCAQCFKTDQTKISRWKSHRANKYRCSPYTAFPAPHRVNTRCIYSGYHPMATARRPSFSACRDRGCIKEAENVAIMAAQVPVRR
jgi:hypothetical protein